MAPVSGTFIVVTCVRTADAAMMQYTTSNGRMSEDGMSKWRNGTGAAAFGIAVGLAPTIGTARRSTS
jgi:hypothetical protein